MEEIKLDTKYTVDFIEEAIDNSVRIARYKMNAIYNDDAKLISFQVVIRIERFDIIHMKDASDLFISVPMKMRNKCAICGKPFEPGEVYSHFKTDLLVPDMSNPRYDWKCWYEAHLDCIYQFFDPEMHREVIEDIPLYRVALQSIRETGGFLLRFGCFGLICALAMLYCVEKWSGQSVLWPEYVLKYLAVQVFLLFEFFN